jgi:hypothetical protein
MKYRWLIFLSVFVVIILDIRYIAASSSTYVKIIGIATLILMFFISLGMVATSIFRGLGSLVSKPRVFVIFNCGAILVLCMAANHRRAGESLATFLVIYLIVLAAFNGTLWISANRAKDWKGGLPIPSWGPYFAFVIFMVAFVNFCAYSFLYDQLSKHHPTDHDLVLPMIAVFIALQLPWLGTIGSYRQTKNLVNGTGSDPLGQIRILELSRILSVYTAILMILGSISSMLH